jgi:phage tail sheath protein FI
MTVYLAPGVYVDEVPSAIRPIAGVGTSTAGFVGLAADIANANMPARPAGGHYTQATALDPEPLNSWEEFKQKYGDFQEANQYLAHAVYGFFNNGGTRCWVSRDIAGRHG